MNTETLELRLKAFRLPSFLAHYAPLAEQAAKDGWSHTHYLDELAAVEAVERAERRIARLLTESKLARDKTMATLDTGRFPAPVRTQVARLAEGQFLEGATNLCVFGNATAPKNENACTCPSTHASAVAAGYVRTYGASLCGRSKAKK